MWYKYILKGSDRELILFLLLMYFVSFWLLRHKKKTVSRLCLGIFGYGVGLSLVNLSNEMQSESCDCSVTNPKLVQHVGYQTQRPPPTITSVRMRMDTDCNKCCQWSESKQQLNLVQIAFGKANYWNLNRFVGSQRVCVVLLRFLKRKQQD